MSITSLGSFNVTLRRCLGSKRSTAKPQKSHLALQMFVIANCREPGQPCWNTSRASWIALLRGRLHGCAKLAPWPALTGGGSSRVACRSSIFRATDIWRVEDGQADTRVASFAMIWIGTSGFQYPEWKGTFY